MDVKCTLESYVSPCEVEDGCDSTKCANCQGRLTPDHLVAWHGHFGQSVCDQECGEMVLNRIMCGFSAEEVWDLALQMMMEAKTEAPGPEHPWNASYAEDPAEADANSATYQQETCAPLALAWDLAHKEEDERAEDAYEEARGDFGE